MNNRMARLLGMLPVVLVALVVAVPAAAQSAFDTYGYNTDAMIFIGTGDSADRTLDGTFDGDVTHANDRLVMRWNTEWARGVQEGWSDPAGYDDAWLSNDWNGHVPGGSGELSSYKFVWVGACENGLAVDSGGECVRGQFAVIVDPGAADAASQLWTTHATDVAFGMAAPDTR